MLIIYESKKTIEEVCAAMEPTVQKHKFGIMATHNLRETMAKKGVTFDKECYIFEICNPHQAKKVLNANLEVSSALPCRVSVYREGGRVKIATLRPTELLKIFNAEGLRHVAEEVESIITAIMREVAE